MKFKVILPVTNQPGYTELCIQHLLLNDNDFDLTVVDNDSLLSTKAMLSSLQKKYSFETITLKEPKRWPAIVNSMIETPNCDFYIILHNDCLVPQTFFKQVIANVVFADPQAAVFTPVTNYSRSPELLVDDHELVEKFKQTKFSNKGIPKTASKILRDNKSLYGDFQEYALSLDNPKKLTFCTHLDAFCLIVDAQVFKERFFFNEGFKTLGWVEREWINRVSLAGYEPWIINNLYVHHHGNLTTDSNGYNAVQLFKEDEKLYRKIENAG